MRSVITSAAAACLLLPLLAVNVAQAKSARGGQPGPAWGEPVTGLRAGLSAQKARYAAGDSDWVKLVLHLRNDGNKKVVLPSAGAEHGWRWEFHLAGGGKPLVPRWDDDTAGIRLAPPEVVLEPGATKTVQASFRQRSFTKWGSGGFCPLVPGRYRVSAAYTHPKTRIAVPKGSWRGKLTTGTVEIEIARRGDAWDKVATAGTSTLVGLLGDPDRQLRQAATAFLSEKGKAAVPALIRGLRNRDAAVRAGSAQILGGLRNDAEPAVEALAKALTDKDSGVQVKAAEALGRIGGGAEVAVPALLRVVKEDRSNSHSRSLPDVRLPAAAALGQIGDASPEVVAALAELTRDKWVQTYGNEYAGVAYALGHLGPEAKAAVPVLVEQLQDKNHRQRGYVLRALQGIGPGAGAAVPALIRLLEDEKESMEMRISAASTLSRIGAAAKEAIPALERVRDRYHSVPREQSNARLLSDVANSAIEEIQKAKPGLPAKSTRAEKGR